MSQWNELTLSELPAIKLLEKLGFTFTSHKILEQERKSLKEPIVIPRLRAAIKRINQWISDDNLNRSVDKIIRIQGTSNIEINRDIHELFVQYFSVKQDRGDGIRPYTVKLIDFDNISNNEFLVTNQYRVVGVKKEIRCDVVCLINGMPIVIIEAKNPVIAGSTPEQAIKQLHRYQDPERGAPRLFYTTQILLAINRVEAFVGTNNTPMQHFLEWKDPYPITIPDVEKIIGRTPMAQDLSIAGVLTPKNLLDIIRNFIVFEVVEGKIVKKVPRYQQYRAVNKTIERILENQDESRAEEDRRGGVIWHTQGSGKSLTMLFLAVKLRRITKMKNPTVMVVTDRIDLDKQINGTFKRCNFPDPIRARSTAHLKELVGQIDLVPGQTILSTIHKFQDKNRAVVYPELATSDNIVVLADEGHRTQYKGLALNMRTAMPNATFIAFTGTPLIKKENITTTKFSRYIDKYSIDQAVRDRATVPIFYESRLPNLHVEKSSFDMMLELELEEYSEEEQEKIKRRYATLRNILGAESRIRQVVVDLYKHFREHIHVNGFKAQVVTIDRLTAVRYKKMLDGIIRPQHDIECAVLYSSSPNDDGDLLRYKTSKEQQAQLISRFKDSEDRLSIIIVVDMLLTGFDAPIEQVMYLDSILKTHNLLQAIARVNRVYKNKTYGLIVDYVGISKYLQQALDVFDQDDIINALIPFSEAVRNLEIAHQAVMKYFENVEDRKNIDKCVEVIIRDDEVLSRFLDDTQIFENAMDTILPDPMANTYKGDFVFIIKLKEYLKRIGKGGIATDFSDIARKIKALIDEYVRSTGIQLIIQPISILSEDFDKHLESIGHSSKARAMMAQHAARQEISMKRQENPEFYDSLSRRLEEIIELYEQQRLTDAEFIREIYPLIKEMRTIRDTASKWGMDETEFAFYNLINARIGDTDEYNEEIKGVMLLVLGKMKKMAVIDWKFKDDIQRRMKKEIKISLLGIIQDSSKRETITIELVELAKNHL